MAVITKEELSRDLTFYTFSGIAVALIAAILAAVCGFKVLRLRTAIGSLEKEEKKALSEQVEASRLELARIDPINLPVRTIKADVFLLLKGEFNERYFSTVPVNMQKGSASLNLSSEDGALVILPCNDFESMPSRSPDAEAVDGRMFTMSMSWPSPNSIDTDDSFKFWVDRNNASTATLDKTVRAAIISLPPSTKPWEIVQGSCVITINGSIRRTFVVPKVSEIGCIVCLPKPE